MDSVASASTDPATSLSASASARRSSLTDNEISELSHVGPQTLILGSHSGCSDKSSRIAKPTARKRLAPTPYARYTTEAEHMAKVRP